MTSLPVPPSKRAIRWWIVTGGYAVLVTVLEVMPAGPGLSVGRLDKLVHLCEYAIFAWCLRHSARLSAFSPSTSLLLSIGLASGYGLFLEGVQGLLGYRSAEWGDAAANAVGAVIGTWINGRLRP